VYTEKECLSVNKSGAGREPDRQDMTSVAAAIQSSSASHQGTNNTIVNATHQRLENESFIEEMLHKDHDLQMVDTSINSLARSG
jgi:hypothetical protein